MLARSSGGAGLSLVRRSALLAFAVAVSGSAAEAQTTLYQNASNLLLPFLDLLNNPDVTSANQQQAISINNNSTAAQRNQAITDNTMSLDNASVVADGLGTRLNQVYQNAINGNAPLLSASGNIVQLFRQADAIAQADAGFAKVYFMNGTIAATGSSTADLRPFQVFPGQIQNFAPSITATVLDNPTFPSGHSTIGYAQELLLAMMVPERYQQLLTRASEYGNSRIVIGSHYPLDIIGGRIIGTYSIVQLLNNNPDYLNQTISDYGVSNVTTSSDFAGLLHSATTDLRNLLQQGCGTEIASCAAGGATDRFSDTKQNRTDYTFRLTYGLPSIGPTNLPPVVPQGAEVLLATRFPYLTAAQRGDVLATTELPSGVPLDDGSGWARLNLYAAADGYAAFNNPVTVTMNAAQGGFNALDYWNNDIGGSGGLTLTGTGMLVLTGADTYSGPTVINGGTLVVNGSIASPTTINPGGTLRGIGAVNAALTNNGTVSPGDPTGTLTVGGSFTQGVGGTFQTRFDRDGAGKLLITGRASLNGALQVTPLNGFAPSFGQTFSILTAGEGVSGTFASFSAPDLPGPLFYQPLYAPHGVAIMAAEPLANFAATANQRVVAATLDRIRTDPDPALQNVLGALYPAEVTGGVPGALDRLTPQNVFSQTLFGRLFADVLADQFAGRAGALRGGATGFVAAPARFDLGHGSLGNLFEVAQANQLAAADGGPGLIPADSRLGGFISGQFVFGDRTFTSSETGRGFTAGGVTLGLDYRLDAVSAIGVGGSYFTGDTSVAGGTTNARGGAISLYGTTGAGPLYLDGFASGGFTDYDTTRQFNSSGVSMTATGAPSGRFAAFGGDSGYRFEQPAGQGLVRWGPVGEFRFNNVAIDGYTERGFGALSSHVQGRDATSVQTGLGAEAAIDMPTTLGLLTPRLRLTWRHEFADTSETAIANFVVAPTLSFPLTSSRLGRDLVAVNAGISGRLGPGIRLSADYAGELGRSNQAVHQISVSARVAF
jgi:autotransporter-associated beta strand protein